MSIDWKNHPHDSDEGLETVLHAAVIGGQLGITAFSEKMFLTNIITGVIIRRMNIPSGDI